MVFHVLNRGVWRMQIFRAEKDYDAFHRVVEETLRVAPIRICAYCWMPNHWHFVLWPQRDGDLSRFLQRMANVHTQRWQRAKLCVGYGHLYQDGSSHSRSKATNTSIAWRGTSSGMLCGPHWSSTRRIGSGEVCSSVQERHAARYWPIGRCPSRPTGSDKSTGHRRKRSWNRSADAFVARVLTATSPGSNRRPRSSACNRRSIVAAAHAAVIREPTTVRILPNICASPLFPPGRHRG